MRDALHVALDVPLLWQDTPVTSHNLLLLRVLALMDVLPAEPESDDEAMTHRLAIEARLDLCLVLLGRLLAQQQPLPISRRVMLSGEEASWLHDVPLPIGQSGALALYLIPNVPEPLCLPARVSACTQEAMGWRVGVEFCIEDPLLQDWLDKTVFRRHRREISERRRLAQHHAPDS
jgi:hypothetical protein